MSDNYNISDMGWAALRRLVKQAEEAILDDLIRFLEDDSRGFGDGYRKEIIWQYIKRYNLTPNDIARLERAALNYLRRPMTREFKLMCQTMARIATEDFWKVVKSELDSDVPRVQINAYCLYPYAEGVYAGERSRLKLNKIQRDYFRRIRRLAPYPDAYSVDDLLALMTQPDNWFDGQIVYKEADPSHLPILYYKPKDGLDFASLDVAAGNKDRILEKLDMILSRGLMSVYTTSTWLYAIYLLHQINDEGAVPILIKFLEDKVDYKFQGVKKSLAERTSLKVLRYYGTIEAMMAVEARAEADRRYSQYYSEFNGGWSSSYPSSD